jgi:RNA polymerase sigma factor (sigma-70 family)
VTREDFGTAYEQGIARTVRFLVSRGVPQEHAQDIAQTAWLRGWERLYQLRNEKLLSTWINSIALNTYRRALYRDRLFQHLGESVRAESCINEASIDLSRIMSGCRPEERALLEAHLAGLTPEEIAAEDGVSRVAVRVRLWRARRAARQEVLRRVRVADLSPAAA